MCVDEFWEIERVTPSENKRKLIEWRRMNQQKGTSLPHTTHVRLLMTVPVISRLNVCLLMFKEDLKELQL